MKVVFAFEYLLKGFSRKDPVQVPSVLAQLLDRDWLYISRPPGQIDEIGRSGTVQFIGCLHTKSNRELVQQSMTSQVTLSRLFSIKAGWAAAKAGDFFVTMFLNKGTALGAAAYCLGRRLRRASGYVYVKADLGERSQKPIEARMRGNLLARFGLFLFQQWVAVTIDLISVETEEGRKWAARVLPRLADRIIVVRNCAPARPEAPTIRKATERRSKRIIAASRLGDPRKGTDVLLAAFRKFHRELAGWELVLAGPTSDALMQMLGPYEDLLQAGSVRYLGFIEDHDALSRLYRSAAIFAQPSRQEGTPLALIEAVHEGCVPVCTPVFPVEELLGEYVHELTVPLEDADALSACLYRLATQPERCGQISEYLQQRTADWTWKSQLEPVVRAYRAKTAGCAV